MFGRYYLYLDRPAGEVSAAVVAWVREGSQRVATGGGQALLRDAGVPLVGVPVYERLELELGAPTIVDDDRGVVMPVRWHAIGGPPLLADMEGDLTFEPFGAARTQLTLTAGYRPPAGQLGALLDRGLVQRLADAVIRDCTMDIEACVGHLFDAPTTRTPGCEYG